MIKKIKIEIVEEKGKRTYKNSVEVKAGAISQEHMKELRQEIINILKNYGLVNGQNGGEE